jgi:hypothetical protein
MPKVSKSFYNDYPYSNMDPKERKSVMKKLLTIVVAVFAAGIVAAQAHKSSSCDPECLEGIADSLRSRCRMEVFIPATLRHQVQCPLPISLKQRTESFEAFLQSEPCCHTALEMAGPVGRSFKRL